MQVLTVQGDIKQYFPAHWDKGVVLPLSAHPSPTTLQSSFCLHGFLESFEENPFLNFFSDARKAMLDTLNTFTASILYLASYHLLPSY